MVPSPLCLFCLLPPPPFSVGRCRPRLYRPLLVTDLSLAFDLESEPERPLLEDLLSLWDLPFSRKNPAQHESRLTVDFAAAVSVFLSFVFFQPPSRPPMGSYMPFSLSPLSCIPCKASNSCLGWSAQELWAVGFIGWAVRLADSSSFLAEVLTHSPFIFINACLPLWARIWA